MYTIITKVTLKNFVSINIRYQNIMKMSMLSLYLHMHHLTFSCTKTDNYIPSAFSLENPYHVWHDFLIAWN